MCLVHLTHLAKKRYNQTMKNLLLYSTQKKELLKSFIQSFFQEQKKYSSGEQSRKALERLEEFALQGKMLRGTFVLLSYEMYGGEVSPDALSIASAVELTHAILLIHDDIMDNDEKRRNAPSMFAQYASDARILKLTSPDVYGKSAAMIVGDVGLLLAFELLSDLNATHDVSNKIRQSFSQEMVRVAYGQLMDFDFGQTAEMRSEKDIENMYKLKTGGYTFTLPFKFGALLSNVADEEQMKLDKLTQLLGITFQLKDDELGIMGESGVTGKSIGSDVREGKKTLLWVRLYAACTDSEKRLLNSFLGSEITREQINEVRSLLQKYKVIERIQDEINDTSIRSNSIVDSLSVDIKYKVILKELIEYNAHRNS